MAKKPDRDGLAICFQPRSGAPLTARAQWKEKDGLDQRLLAFTQMHLNNLFPDGAAYDLARLALDYKTDWDSAESKKRAIVTEAIRRLSKKGLKEHKEQLEKLEKRIEVEINDEKDLLRIADEIKLARRFADAYKQSGRKAWELTHHE